MIQDLTVFKTVHQTIIILQIFNALFASYHVQVVKTLKQIVHHVYKDTYLILIAVLI